MPTDRLGYVTANCRASQPATNAAASTSEGVPRSSIDGAEDGVQQDEREHARPHRQPARRPARSTATPRQYAGTTRQASANQQTGCQADRVGRRAAKPAPHRSEATPDRPGRAAGHAARPPPRPRAAAVHFAAADRRHRPDVEEGQQRERPVDGQRERDRGDAEQEIQPAAGAHRDRAEDRDGVWPAAS